MLQVAGCRVGGGAAKKFRLPHGRGGKRKRHSAGVGAERRHETLLFLEVYVCICTILFTQSSCKHFMLIQRLVHPIATSSQKDQLHYPSPSSSSSSNLKLKGSKATPSPMKCLLIASTQCNRKLCNIALVPSMTQRIAIVKKNQT